AELRLLTVRSALMTRGRVDGKMRLDPPTESLVCPGQTRFGHAMAHATDVGILRPTLSSWDDVPGAITQIAAAEDCDLIVMGGRPLTGPRRWLLGDPLNAMAAKAQQPILVVKQPPPPKVGVPLWRRILVATSDSPWSDAAVEYGLTLAWLQELELSLLHVDRAGSEAGADWDATSGKNLLAQAEARAAALGLSYDGVLATGDTVNAIVKTARRKQCDVIVLGSHSTTGWTRLITGGIANAVAAKAALPVLLVKRFMRL
ncbi:MAG: universal stress protein, partial [Candidatus Tectomicrobia bacterium]|nr:universal stress protein [Candidatus Tectomicrobia bacterium]